jgi:uncharacterized protein YuzE
MAEVWYDKEADAIGIMLKDKNHWKGVEVSKHVVVDLSKDGEIVGIEILGVKEAFKKDAQLIVSRTPSKTP